MDAALNDNVGFDAGGLDRKLEAVAHHIRNAVIDLRRHVVVREDDRVLLFLELVDRGDVGRVTGPVDRIDHAVHLGKRVRHRLCQLGVRREVVMLGQLFTYVGQVEHGVPP